MGDSSISWIRNPDGSKGKTWNPVRGCSRTCSEGTHQTGCGDGSGGGCYAEEQAGRIVKMSRGRGVPEGQGPYDGLVRLTANGWRWTGQTRVARDHLGDPLTWQNPTRIFVNSMSDLFHDGFSDADIAEVFAVMGLSWWHTHIVLTKRTGRAGVLMRSTHFYERVLARAAEIRGGMPQKRMWRTYPEHHRHPSGFDWPLRNVWLGASICNRADLAERGPELRATPATIRVWSVEPQLEDLGDVREYLGNAKGCGWLLNGCESGERARPFEFAWPRSLRNQCRDAGVPFFFKQARHVPACIPAPPGAAHNGTGWVDIVDAGEGSERKRDGVIEMPYLDGFQHLEWPEAGR